MLMKYKSCLFFLKKEKDGALTFRITMSIRTFHSDFEPISFHTESVAFCLYEPRIH